MTVQTLQTLFSHICGQGRCFLVDGAPLPVCQRCMGLYAAAAITGACLLATGTWRRGLPSRGVMLMHASMLLAAMLGGLHTIDAGSAWRLICGLWTGHVAITWLLNGSAILSSRISPASLSLRYALFTPVNQPLTWVAYSSPILYVFGAVAFVQMQPPGWWIWTVLMCAGVIIAIAAVPIGTTMIVIRLLR